MAQPIAASAPITAASLTVGGSVPDDAALTVRLTNNAADDQPVWQDATEAVRQGKNVLFANQTAANGPAFNFRVEVSRGPSGTGGYNRQRQRGVSVKELRFRGNHFCAQLLLDKQEPFLL